MQTLRKYGKPPFETIVVHGGPGAPGEMKQVAQELSQDLGVLEPLQTANSIDGQVRELKSIIEKFADKPVFLIGYSWGAWLSFIFTSENPGLVKKLILVSSGPFEQRYADQIMKTRRERLSDKEKSELDELSIKLQNGQSDSTLQRFGQIMSKADSFDSLEHQADDSMPFQPEIYSKVWEEAEQLRKSGKLLEFAKKITCPVVAIHGDFDPHPARGVEEPLSKVIKNFRFITLKNCGHTPWFEKEAKEEFYSVLKREFS